jgi:hypothetical protein
MRGAERFQEQTDIAATVAQERRVHKRKLVLLMGTLETETGSFSCSIFNLSLGGAKLAVAAKTKPSQPVTLTIARGGTLHAAVVWESHGEIGVRFTDDPRHIAYTLTGILTV